MVRVMSLIIDEKTHQHVQNIASSRIDQRSFMIMSVVCPKSFQTLGDATQKLQKNLIRS